MISMEEFTRGSSNGNVMLLQPFIMNWGYGQGPMTVLTDEFQAFKFYDL